MTVALYVDINIQLDNLIFNMFLINSIEFKLLN